MSVYASHVWVTWATKINAAVKKVSISNVGGQDNPIGAAVLYVDLKVSTVVNSMSFNSIAQARGDKAEMFLSGLTKK